MTSFRRPLLGFVLPYVNGDVQAAEDVVRPVRADVGSPTAQRVP